jgi:high-affinity Fe2+/Pb2+ permease
MTCKSAQREKIWLLAITGLAIALLGGIAIYALSKSENVNSESATLVGVVVAGLGAFAKDAIGAVRAFWQDDRMGKMTDQIAASAPASLSDAPQEVKVVNPPDDPANVTEARQ